MTIRTDNITLRHLVLYFLFRKLSTLTANFEIFLAWVTMVKLHDPEWPAHATIHTRHIFRFLNQFTTSLPNNRAEVGNTLAASIASKASFATERLVVRCKIINGQVTLALGTSQGVTHNVFRSSAQGGSL